VTLFGSEPGAEDDPADGPGREDVRSGAEPAPGQVRLRMTLAYDGSGFRGFAAQPGQTTVAGTLALALETVIGHPVELSCAGRTDSGVHASGQVVHFDFDPNRARSGGSEPDLDGIRRSCNRMLGPAIVVKEVLVAPPGFHARHSARWRRYRYLVLNREVPDPFLASTSWHVDVPLDLRAMQLACDAIHGEHDFSAFCRRPPDGGSLVRRVAQAEWIVPPSIRGGRGTGGGGSGQAFRARLPAEARGWEGVAEMISFEITATAFCHQMVRSLVGTMVEVGRGRKRAGDMAGILRSGERAGAGSPAPPRGLCLEEVGY
jgi:tRNA pseudouridine38-40 synthase